MSKKLKRKKKISWESKKANIIFEKEPSRINDAPESKHENRVEEREILPKDAAHALLNSFSDASLEGDWRVVQNKVLLRRRHSLNASTSASRECIHGQTTAPYRPSMLRPHQVSDFSFTKDLLS